MYVTCVIFLENDVSCQQGGVKTRTYKKTDSNVLRQLHTWLGRRCANKKMTAQSDFLPSNKWHKDTSDDTRGRRTHFNVAACLPFPAISVVLSSTHAQEQQRPETGGYTQSGMVKWQSHYGLHSTTTEGILYLHCYLQYPSTYITIPPTCDSWMEEPTCTAFSSWIRSSRNVN